MLTEDEKNYMVEILATQLGANGQPRQDLVGPFFNTEFARELTTTGNARMLAIDAIRLCIMDGWNHDPTWLELIIHTFDLKTLDARVIEISERLKHKPPAAPDPLDDYILINGSLFINRVNFREKVNRLNSAIANTQPILVVTGIPKSGKSYSHTFIDHFTNHYPSTFVYKYEFEKELGLEIGPELVAVDLVAKMGRPVNKTPALETNLKLFSRQLALWVLNEAVQSFGQHWFVLDNFDGSKLRQDTKDFILELTNLVTNGIFQRRCRIVLIGFDTSSLTVDQAQYDEEFIAKCSPADIRKATMAILALSHSALNPDDFYTFVTNNLPAEPAKMMELNARLRALLVGIKTLKQMLSSMKEINFQEVLLSMLKDLPEGKEKVKELKQRLQFLLESKMEMSQS